MHGISPQQFAETVSSFLVPFYIALALMNGIAAYYLWKKTSLKLVHPLIWVGVASIYVLLAAFAANANLAWIPTMPMVFRQMINQMTGPVAYSVGTTLVLVVLYWGRSWFVKPVVAWSIWNLMFLFLCLSMPDPNFYTIVAKPDNVPIVAMVFLLAFFTWLAAYQAVTNDRRKEEGLPPLEKENDEKILVWPDLVYTELICMIAITTLLIVWAIWLQAPLEEPASSVKTPNPSKAPWYFLGLQEMLVYFDPWMAGVVLPNLIVVGLMAIPYLDFNKGGNGYYTIKERPFAYITFQLGFLELWITLIILGTLLRGPNWNFFGPYEYWDAHKVLSINNVNLSEYFWHGLCDRSLPAAPAVSWFASWFTWLPDSLGWLSTLMSSLGQFLCLLFGRELPGTLLVLGYFIALPPLLAVSLMRGFYKRMGFIRFMLLTNLLLFMASLPIKMVLRWTFDLKYLIAIPEYLFNF